MKKLGIESVTGKNEWSTAVIDRMLSNEKHIGNALLQKAFIADPLTHKQAKNIGQQTMRLVKNSHEAIISKDVFEAVLHRKQGDELPPMAMAAPQFMAAMICVYEKLR